MREREKNASILSALSDANNTTTTTALGLSPLLLFGSILLKGLPKMVSDSLARLLKQIGDNSFNFCKEFVYPNNPGLKTLSPRLKVVTGAVER